MGTAEGPQVSKEPLLEDCLSKDGTAKEPHGPACFLFFTPAQAEVDPGPRPLHARPPATLYRAVQKCGGGSVGSMLPWTHRLGLMPLVTCSPGDGVQLAGPWITCTQSPAPLPPHLVLIHCN